MLLAALPMEPVLRMAASSTNNGLSRWDAAPGAGPSVRLKL